MQAKPSLTTGQPTTEVWGQEEQGWQEEHISWRVRKVGWGMWNDLFVPCIWAQSTHTRMVNRWILDGWLVIQVAGKRGEGWEQEELLEEYDQELLEELLANPLMYVGTYGPTITAGITDQYVNGEKDGYLYDLVREGLDNAWLVPLNREGEVGKAVDLLEKWRTERRVVRGVSQEGKVKHIQEVWTDVRAVAKVLEEMTEWLGRDEAPEHLKLARTWWDPAGLVGGRKEELRERSVEEGIVGQLLCVRGTLMVYKQGYVNYVTDLRSLEGRELVNLEEGFVDDSAIADKL